MILTRAMQLVVIAVVPYRLRVGNVTTHSCCRVLAVTSFRTYTMADLRKPIRFDKCDLQLSILGAKSPGLRVEPLEKASVGG